MIERLVRASVAHRGLVIAFTAAFAIAAGFFATELRFDALPDVTGKQVLVLTQAPGLTPEEVELRVTRPIEIALGGMPGVIDQRSISRYGLSSITAIFSDDTEIFRARQVVQERLQSVASSLPPGVDPPELGPVTGGLGEIYQFTLSSSRLTPIELREIVQVQVAPILRSVSGVVEVNTWGGARRTLDVVGDPTLMALRRIDLATLTNAVERATGSVAGASLSAGNRQTFLRGIARPASPAELAAAVVVASSDGTETTTIRVGDVAHVVEGREPRIGAATEGGRGETVYVMVQMMLGANALDVLEGVHGRMPIVRSILPPDVELREVYDRSDLVYATLRTVGKNLLEGGLLVVLVLFATLGSFRAGLLVASVIPLSMLGAVIGMVLLDIPGNLMSLGALDFGLLVDGAVVMVEAVFHHVHEHERRDGSERLTGAVGMIAPTVARPVFYSVLIIALVYIPIITLGGVEGKMFRPMAMTVVLALVTSLVLALTFIPAAASFFLRVRDVPTREPLAVRILHRVYRPLLDHALARPLAVAAISLGLLAIGGILYARAGTAFIPQLDEGDLVIQTTRAPDIDIESAIERAGRLEETLLARFPEVEHVASRIGSPAVATDIMGLEQSDVFVDLVPRERFREGVTRDALIAEMNAVLTSADPGTEYSFTQPIQMRFNELLGGAVTDVGLSLFGEDLDRLRDLATQAADAIRRVPGAVDVRVLSPPTVDLLEVRPRPLALAPFGLRADDVLRIVSALRTGIATGETYDGPIRIPIRVRFGAPPSPLLLDALPIPLGRDRLVSLGRIAEVRRLPSPALVNHEQGERRVVVGFNVRERDLGSVVDDAERVVARAFALPPGYRAEWGGQYESLQHARARLRIVVPLVMAAIVSVLLLLFRQVRPALLIFLNVPFAAVGGVVAIAARDLPVSISAAIGFIALSGIAVLNGVVLMSRIVAAEREGKSPSNAAHDAALSRSRPVIMTASVAALGFVPMMLATGVGAEVQRPLATVVVGGLVTSTLLTLVILPTLYPWASRLGLVRRSSRPRSP